MNQKKRQSIFDRLAAAIPEPATELNYSSPFELLIAVVLSAQATDRGVNKATTRLFAMANDQWGPSMGSDSNTATLNLYLFNNQHVMY